MRATALACALVVAISPAPVFGVPLASVRQQADAAKARIGAMEQELSSSMSEYDAAATALAATRADIAANRRRRAEIDASMQDGQRRLSAEVVFLYRTDGTGFTEALLSSQSVEEFMNRMLALTRMASRDAEIIGRLKRGRARVADLDAVLADRETQQAALVADVSARRAKAQAAITDQQRYADSLSAKVAAVLRAASTRGGPKAPTRPPSNRFGIAWATVEGRSGRYAVLANQPKMYSPSGITFTGLATWYGNYRPNMRTASGRPFNENEFTCAHKTLPFGTRIAVTYRGKRVIVTVTDRGPYGKGRVIDLTKRAAAVIGLQSAGFGKVHCEIVRPN